MWKYRDDSAVVVRLSKRVLCKNASGSGCIIVEIISYNYTSLKKEQLKRFAENAVINRIDNCNFISAMLDRSSSSTIISVVQN